MAEGAGRPALRHKIIRLKPLRKSAFSYSSAANLLSFQNPANQSYPPIVHISPGRGLQALLIQRKRLLYPVCFTVIPAQLIHLDWTLLGKKKRNTKVLFSKAIIKLFAPIKFPMSFPSYSSP